MVTTLQEHERPEPWLKKKTFVPASTRETRTASRANARNNKKEEPKNANVPSASARGRRNLKGKGTATAKGMKKTKPMPAATVDVLLGRAENVVRSVEEMNRKTEEDARACGRITRTVLNPGTRNFCPTAASNFQDGEKNHNKSPAAEFQVPCNSPNILANDVPSGTTHNYVTLSRA